MEVINPDDDANKLPLDKLAGFTCDGASVMISPKQGVLGKLRATINPKPNSTHSPPHRLALAANEDQKEIPVEIEKLCLIHSSSSISTQSDKMSLLVL